MLRKAAAAAAEEGDPMQDLRRAWREQVRFGLDHPAVFRLMTDPARAARHPRPAPAARRSRPVCAASRRPAAGHRGSAGRAHPRRRHRCGARATRARARPARPGVADELADAVLDRIVTPAPGATGAGTRAMSDAGSERLAAVVALHAHVPRLDALTPPERALPTQWLERV